MSLTGSGQLPYTARNVRVLLYGGYTTDYPLRSLRVWSYGGVYSCP